MIQNGLNRPPRDDNGPTPGRPRIGEPFNPWHKVCGFYPPDIVGRQTDLTDGQKRLYERGVRWCGKNGAFWYSFERIATELGKSARQVKRDMAGLEKRGLVQHERRGKQQSNRYRFLYHPMFESDGTSTSHHRAEGEVTDLSGEVTSMSQGDVTPASHELCKENRVRESSSSENSGEHVTPEGKTDDDEPIFFGPEEPKTNPPEGAIAPEGDTNREESSEAAAVAEDATASEVTPSPAVGNPEDLEGDLLKIAQEKLHWARAASLTLLREATPEALAATIPPDREITLKILEAFHAGGGDDGGAAFEAWLKSTVERKLGQKAESQRWGLYLKDAEMEARNLPIQREASAKYQAAADLSRARRQAEQAEEEKAAAAEADRPVSAVEAYGRIRGAIQGRGVPRLLKWRLERTGELVSPNALEAAIRSWKRCPTCQDSGTVGTAIDKTLAFCACAAGIEAQHPPLDSELRKPEAERFHKGADYCCQTVERVHSSSKSLLVAACIAVGLQYAADVVADSEVSDADEVLEIRISDAHFGIDQGDVYQALGRLKWQRRIVISGGQKMKRSQPVPSSKPEAAAPARPPITQADIDVELAKRRQKMPPQMEAGCDLAACSSAGGIQ